MNHSPSETPRLLHVDTHSRQLIRCVTQHVSMTEDEPDSSSPTHPPVPPTHSPTQTHTELSLFSHLSPSPQQTAVGRPSIATGRRDGPLGFEFQMTEQWSWYGHRGSCWGTVLPLLWLGPNRPAPKPLIRISSLGAQYHQTWWQSALVHPSQLIFIPNHVADYKYHMFTHAAFTFTYICITDSLVRFYLQFAAKKKKKLLIYLLLTCFWNTGQSVFYSMKHIEFMSQKGQTLKISLLNVKTFSRFKPPILSGIITASSSSHTAISFLLSSPIHEKKPNAVLVLSLRI